MNYRSMTEEINKLCIRSKNIDASIDSLVKLCQTLGKGADISIIANVSSRKKGRCGFLLERGISLVPGILFCQNILDRFGKATGKKRLSVEFEGVTYYQEFSEEEYDYFMGEREFAMANKRSPKWVVV